SSDTIHIVHQDKSDNLWIGTHKGLDLLTLVDKQYQSEESPYTAASVIKSSKGKWGSAFITSNSDILLVKEGQRRVEKITIGGDMLRPLLLTKYGDILYIARNDVCILRLNLSAKTLDKHIEGNNPLCSMYVDTKGNLWIEKEGSVLYL